MEQLPLMFENQLNSSGKVIIFVDGASRGNPGDSGIGCYLDFRLAGGKEEKIGCFIGNHFTNNQAEYLALAAALCFLAHCAPHWKGKVLIHSDSLLLVNQMKRVYRVKNEALIELNSFCYGLVSAYDYSFVHVMREYNQVADALANEGINYKKLLPRFLFQQLSTFKLTSGLAQ